MLRRKSQATVTDTAVPGFYTRASYRDVFLAQLDDAAKDMIEEESWCCATARKEKRGELAGLGAEAGRRGEEALPHRVCR